MHLPCASKSRDWPLLATLSSVAFPLFVAASILTGCSQDRNARQPEHQPEPTRLIPVGGPDNTSASVDIVFVHGLGGDGYQTWQATDHRDSFWPTWLAADFPDARVWSVDYEAHASHWFGETVPIQDRAIGLLEELRLNGIGEDKPILFIVHSMGGLVVKQMLRKASDSQRWRTIDENARGVLFLATPHSGSLHTTLIDFVSKVIPIAVRSTITSEQLSSNAPYLRDLNQWYRDKIDHEQVYTHVLSETVGIGGALIVPENSADPGITGVTPVPIPENDHLQISKPPNRESIIYRSAVDFIKKASPPASNVSMQKYLDREVKDRWKLIGHRVDWTGTVTAKSLKKNQGTYVLIGKEDDRGVEKNRVRAIMLPDQYIEVKEGTSIRVSGILGSSSENGTILHRCKLIDEGVEAAE